MALVAWFFRQTPPFKGKDRLTQLWLRRQRGRVVEGTVPGVGRMSLDLGVPYEASVWLGRSDRRELAVLRQLLAPGDVFVDGGANVGLWTLAAASAVGPAGTVVAFEPQPGVYAKLVDNVRRSGYEDRVRPFSAAVGAEPGQASFVEEEMHDMSRIAPDGGGEATVDVVRLDDVVVARPVRGIKLDVEGYELEALRGAETILLEDRPWVCVELNPGLAGVHGLGEWAVHELLVGRGYRARVFADAGRPEPLPESWSIDHGHCNLLYTVG